MNRYTLGICEWSFPLTGPAGVEMMKHYGIETVQLDLGPYDSGLPLSVPEIQQAYMDASQKSGVAFHSVACSDLGLFGMTNDPQSEKGQIAREIIQKGIDAAAAMKVPAVMVTNFRDGLITDETGYRNSCQCIRWACERAWDKGLALISESAMSSEQILRLADTIAGGPFGICLDTQNPFLRWGYNVAERIGQLKDIIYFVHVKDGADGKISSKLLGEGDSGFEQSVEALRKIDYSGVVMLENLYNKKPLSLLAENPFDILKTDIERYRRYFG